MRNECHEGYRSGEDNIALNTHFPRIVRFSSKDVIGKRKAEALTEFFARELIHVDVMSRYRDSRMVIAAMIVDLGGITIFSCTTGPIHFRRSVEVESHDAKEWWLTTASVDFVVETPEAHFIVPAGGAILLSDSHAHDIIVDEHGTMMSIRMPHGRLEAYVPECAASPIVVIDASSPALGLAFGFGSLIAQVPSTKSGVPAKSLDHLMDLISQAITEGADGESDDVTHGALVRGTICENLGNPGLSLDQVARLHKVTARFIQRLFERENMTFSDYVRRIRLDRARTLLEVRGRSGKRIADIARECGFSEITTFNRAFRRQFGCTPSEMQSGGNP